MMSKKNLCIGPMFSYSSWKDYWEGTRKRDNENLGTVSTQMYSVMGNYGVSDKLNVLFGLPYVKTKASAGTMSGLKGIQDFCVHSLASKDNGSTESMMIHSFVVHITPEGKVQALILRLRWAVHSAASKLAVIPSKGLRSSVQVSPSDKADDVCVEGLRG